MRSGRSSLGTCPQHKLRRCLRRPPVRSYPPHTRWAASPRWRTMNRQDNPSSRSDSLPAACYGSCPLHKADARLSPPHSTNPADSRRIPTSPTAAGTCLRRMACTPPRLSCQRSCPRCSCASGLHHPHRSGPARSRSSPACRLHPTRCQAIGTWVMAMAMVMVMFMIGLLVMLAGHAAHGCSQVMVMVMSRLVVRASGI